MVSNWLITSAYLAQEAAQSVMMVFARSVCLIIALLVMMMMMMNYTAREDAHSLVPNVKMINAKNVKMATSFKMITVFLKTATLTAISVFVVLMTAILTLTL